MAVASPLCELFTVAERFRRSVNIASDYRRKDALTGYIITPLSQSVLLRIGAGLEENARGRAWSITGPYGAGKSACMLFAAQVLAYPVNTTARALVQDRDHGLCQQLREHIPGWAEGGFVIVPVVGSRQPLAWTLLTGLMDAVDALDVSSPDLLAHRLWLQELYAAGRSDQPLPPTEMALAVEQTAKVLQASTPDILGLLIVYDELGKSLEYAAINPEYGDIGLLQTLAEMASRSQDPTIGLVTVLHQAFEHYAATLSPIQQREWAKVQGRFEDIGFLASPGELLTLINRAIQPTEIDRDLAWLIHREVEEAASLGLFPSDLNGPDAQDVLAGCAPLHPTVSLVLGRLFRSRLAQNERSLFAFLSSSEPYGLQEYLREQPWSNNGHRPFYRLDGLYDYVVAALGSGLYVQSSGKRWAEIEEALQRLPKEASLLDARIIKSIGMLSLLGDQRYLRASGDVLTYALADGETASHDIQASLSRLVDWDIVLYRRFKDAYSLWQGSDIDLDELWDQGLAHIDRNQSLADLLRGPGQLKPYIAKRHLHETGTFRFLIPWVIDLEDIDQIASRTFGDADGVVVFVLPPVGAQFTEVTARIAQFSASLSPEKRELVFFAIPRHLEGIREAFEEQQVWEWVTENTPALEGDSVARRELAARRLAARDRLARACARSFDMSLAFRSCLWIHQGTEYKFDTVRQLSSTLSDACDHAYNKAPIVRNELINRRSLSSAVAAARRNLIERMLYQGHEERLGLEGYPPELSIYLSVLVASGMHYQEGDHWAVGLPQKMAAEVRQNGKSMHVSDPARILPLWNALDSFFASTENEAKPVMELYEILSRPPYGIKEGLLPIYVTAAFLHWQRALAMYEEGTFVPQPRMPEFERLLRAPERFSVRRYEVHEARFRLLHAYSTLFGGDMDPGEVSVLTAVRPLIAFIRQLPQYTILTRSLSEEAITIRDALLAAREPQPLLLEQLPEALGLAPLGPGDVSQVPDYVDRLKRHILELQNAYDRLLRELEMQIQRTLLLPSQLAEARREIGRRARVIRDWVADADLKPFVMRLADVTLQDREWLESVAAVLVHKPPNAWNDGDANQFRISLQEMAGRFRRTEDAALAMSAEPSRGTERVLRLGVTDAEGQERRRVLNMSPDDEEAVAKVVANLEKILRASHREPRLQLLALAQLAERLMDTKEEEAHRD